MRIDNIGIVVSDVEAAIAFFAELGLTVEGRTSVTGDWVDTTVGLTGVECDIVMLRSDTIRLELATYRHPALMPAHDTPANTVGLHRLMFNVPDIDKTVEKLQAHGATLLGGIARYEDAYRLCYMRGIDGIILALAQELS